MRWFLGLLFCWVWPLLAQEAVDGEVSLAEADRAALAALADVLEDPARRERLIGELRRISAEVPAAASGEMAADEAGGQKADEGEAIKAVTENAKAAVSTVFTLPKRLVVSGKALALEVGGNIGESWEALVGVFSGRDVVLRHVDMAVVRERALRLGGLVGLTLLLYQGARFFGRRLRGRLQRWVIEGERYKPLVRRLLATLAVSALDVLMLLLAVVLASVATAMVFGEEVVQGALGAQVMLFVEAYVVIELLKTALRALFFPRYPGLRLLPASNAVAFYWHRVFVNLINLLGYGYMVILPLIHINLSWSLGRVFSVLLAFAAFAYGITMMMRKRGEVRGMLLAKSKTVKGTLLAVMLRLLSRIWHWLALGYFVMLLVVTVLRADKALPFLLNGTLDTVLIVGGGLLVSALLGQYAHYRFDFSREWQQRVPGLDKRLNVLLPPLLSVLRFVVLGLVVFGVLSAWNVIDGSGWMSSQRGQAFIDKWSGVLLIIVMTALLWLVFTSIIEHRLHAKQGRGASARAQTLLSLFRSALTVVVFSIAGMMVLSEMGINIGPLIAGAGVLGLAIGFGAQKLVQDIITGIFFQIENAMNRGDVVTVDGITGTAEHISIRSVGVRDNSGTYHLIPFSNVTRVSNYMRGYANHIAEYGIAYHENIDDAIVQLRAAFDELMQGDLKHYILEPINVHGVTQLADSAVMIRISIKTTPGDQWIVGRAYNRLVKMYFDAANIEIPFPHMQVYVGTATKAEEGEKKQE
ncbi:MAG: mechanosensitive ion channel [Cardiobacteriaceae bacterium]|nr:mechanosensitive ion channel [Cardiobacteriaceae bacterium]